jgi:predicted homoserine dehydrogenase-like protein
MLHHQLEALEQQGKPIRVGIVGCGRMGTGVINQVARCKGMRVVAATDAIIERARTALCNDGRSDRTLFTTSDPDEAGAAIERGQTVLTTESKMIPHLPVDVVIDATGIPESGARTAYDAIMARKHVVTLNVESDAVIGPILGHLAKLAGVVYTVTAGDEPGAIAHLYDWAVTCGLRVVVAGKGSMRPIDWNANPETLAEEAAALKLNPKMLASFRDGSKHCVEMCVVCNGTGLVPDVRGTHARSLALDEMASVMQLQKDGGMLSQEGVVEIVPPVLNAQGKPDLARSLTPGVYLIVTADHPQIHADFKYLLMGDGPNYLIYRPYHLCAIETPHSVASAFLRGEATLAPLSGPVAEVICVAKRDLKAGELITGSGGAEITGQLEKHALCKQENLLPIGMAYDIPLKRDVARGAALTVDDVELDKESLLYKLWQLQLATFD